MSFFLVDHLILCEMFTIDRYSEKDPSVSEAHKGKDGTPHIKTGNCWWYSSCVLIQTTSWWFMGWNLQTKQLGTVFRQVKGLRHQNIACVLNGFLLIKMKQSHRSEHSAQRHSWRCAVQSYFSITRLWIVQQFEHNWLATTTFCFIIIIYVKSQLKSGSLSYCSSSHFLDGVAPLQG